MKTTKPDKALFTIYTESFRVQVHKLIAWGYDGARHMIHSNNEQETAITEFIAEAIEDRLLNDFPRWLNHYFVKDDPPVRSHGRSGRARPRADIVIQANFVGRPEYVFEAKRLKKGGYGSDRYIGKDGIGRFISGLYASRHNEAAMLGYVQSNSPTYWRDKVKDTISINSRLVYLESPQQDVLIIDSFPLEWSSEHKRPIVGRSIFLYHILMDCIV